MDSHTVALLLTMTQDGPQTLDRVHRNRVAWLQQRGMVLLDRPDPRDATTVALSPLGERVTSFLLQES